MLILDTDIARAFAKAGHFDMLIKLFRKVGITPMVYEELQIPLRYGYTYPEEIFNFDLNSIGQHFEQKTTKPYPA